MESLWKSFVGKKIFIILKSGRNYEGVIESVSEDFILMTDKFGKRVGFSQGEIKLLQEESYKKI